MKRTLLFILLVLCTVTAVMADKPLRTRKSPDGSTFYDVLPQGCSVVRDTLYGLAYDTLTFQTEPGAEFPSVYVKLTDGPSQATMARDSFAIRGRELPSYSLCDTPIGSKLTSWTVKDTSGSDLAVFGWISGRLYKVTTFSPNYGNAYQFLLQGSSADTINYEFWYLQGKVGF